MEEEKNVGEIIKKLRRNNKYDTTRISGQVEY